MTSVYDFTADRLNGKSEKLSKYKGKVMLVVNTASSCGLTPQFEGLEALYKEFKSQGLRVLGFPCNQFNQQESGTSKEIGEFCQINYGVSFPMFEKIEVNGPNAHPFFEHLKSEKRGFFGTKKVKWNFSKFLVDRDGNVVKRFAPTATAGAMRESIKALL